MIKRTKGMSRRTKGIMAWVVMSDTERRARNLPTTDAEACRFFHIVPKTLKRHQLNAYETVLTQPVTEKKVVDNKPKLTGEAKDKVELEEVLASLKTLCLQRGNATAGQIWLKAKGILDKSEKKVVYTLEAEDYYRIREEAQRRLAEQNGTLDRVGGLFPVATIFDEKVRVHTGEEQSAETGEVADVELSF